MVRSGEVSVSFRAMRFASALHEGMPMAVFLDGDQAVPLRGIRELGPDTPRSLLLDPPLEPDSAFPAAELERRAVVPHPGKVICVGLNYAAHIEETQARALGLPRPVHEVRHAP